MRARSTKIMLLGIHVGRVAHRARTHARRSARSDVRCTGRTSNLTMRTLSSGDGALTCTSMGGPLLLLLTFGGVSSEAFSPQNSFIPAQHASSQQHRTRYHHYASTTTPVDHLLDSTILERIESATPSAVQWGESFDQSSSEVAFYALFAGLKSCDAALGLKGRPFYLKQADVVAAMNTDSGSTSDDNDNVSSPFAGFFTFEDLKTAVEDDFLDANRGSTNNAQGWKVTGVSKPRGSSFEDARMTLNEVKTSLTKGTVIFNAIGAHIPKLAGPTLACCDASSLPNALNMYVTAAGMKTSAPPHTDRQDVVVVQTQGRKHWRVYTPPNPALDSMADMYARGKGEDALALHALESTHGCTKLIDVTLEAGDVLFVPAGFPHTTDTAEEEKGEGSAEVKEDATSIHLTFNLDTHVWDLDYLSARRLALARAGVPDTALGQTRDTDNRYVGQANLLPSKIRADLFEALPLGLLEDDDVGAAMVDQVAANLERISLLVDVTTASAVPASVWKETVVRLRQQGMELYDIHRDMYLAAIEEGRIRKTELEMTAHLTGEALERARAMTPEKMQRLSLFRVRDYYEKINASKGALVNWSKTGTAVTDDGGVAASVVGLPANWEYTAPLQVGDEVEADLGGAFFPARVSAVTGNTYSVEYFDGDKDTGLERSMIKLMKPPAAASDEDELDIGDTTGLTPKEIKKLKKKAQKRAEKRARK